MLLLRVFWDFSNNPILTLEMSFLSLFVLVRIVADLVEAIEKRIRDLLKFHWDDPGRLFEIEDLERNIWII